jgi:hypothetical protein
MSEPMANKPGGQRRFWATSLPWKLLFLLAYFALGACMLVMFWVAPYFWNSRLAWPVWGLMLAAFGFNWIYFIRTVTREFQSLRRPTDRADF